MHDLEAIMRLDITIAQMVANDSHQYMTLGGAAGH